MQSNKEGKYQFTSAQREALWRAWDQRCFYCSQTLSFADVTIDHVVPERLLYHSDEYNKVKDECPIPSDFKINGYENWVPAHGQSCNGRKGGKPFAPQTTIWYLALVTKKSPKVLNELEKLKTVKNSGRVLATLETQIEKGNISEKEAINSASKKLSELEMDKITRVLAYSRNIEAPLVVSIGLNLNDFYERGDTNESLFLNLPHLCDALEKQLITYLRSLSNHLFYYVEESNRNGECLTVRLVYPHATLSTIAELNLSQFDLAMWEILEVTHFYDVCGRQYTPEIDSELSQCQIRLEQGLGITQSAANTT